MTYFDAESFGQVWTALVADLLLYGDDISPRTKPTKELLDVKIVVSNSLRNVLVNPVRNPSYRFMVAEWLWIWFGRDDVASIAQYNPHIAQFSDDGISFAGAYGPRVVAQLQNVITALEKDPNTRQAVIRIFDEKARDNGSRDVACTLSLQFFNREGHLHTIANMRSSDVWLGLPYDFFNFSMIGNAVAAWLNLKPGHLSMNLGSSHLYHSNIEAAQKALTTQVQTIESPRFPSFPIGLLEKVLSSKRLVGLKDPLWSAYEEVLVAPTNSRAKEILHEIEP